MSKTLPRKFYKKPQLQPQPETIVLKPRRMQFPSISLTIPEKVLSKTILSPVFLTAFTFGFILMGIGIVGNNLRLNLNRLQSVRYERQKIQQQIITWKWITEKYPGYRDGLYQLAVLEYRVGNKQAALNYLQQSLTVDPNFKNAKQLINKIMVK